MARIALAAVLSVTAAAQGLWERRAPYPISATEVSAASLDGRVYAVCGLVAGRSVSSLYIYNPRHDEWSEGAPLPVAGGADHCNVAVAAGRLYVLGAIRIGSAFVDGDTHEYDPASNRWQVVGRMPTARGASGVAAIGSRIYVAGGLAGGVSVATFEVFDAATRQWSRLPDMPTARDHLTAQAANGKFYAIAGRAGREFTANEEYDPSTGLWTTRAPIPTQRGGLGSGTIGGRIQVFGGEGASGTPEGTYRQNEEYDPSTDTWRSLAPMPTPRHGLYGATLDGRIFTPSGGPRAGGFFSDAHEVFYLPPSPAPLVSAAELRNAASAEPLALSPGGVVSMFGERLSFGEQEFTRFPAPAQMNAVVVRVDQTPLPLFYAGPTQVNFLLPHQLPVGPARITLFNVGVASATLEVMLLDNAPGIFSLTLDGRGQGAILNAGTALVARASGDTLSRAPRRGEYVEIYSTGLGRVSNPPGPGQAATANPFSETLLTPVVTMGGARAVIQFSGLAPGLAGVYQVNAQVPMTAPVGAAVPVTIRMGEDGRVSNTVTMAVAE